MEYKPGYLVVISLNNFLIVIGFSNISAYVNRIYIVF